MPAPLVWVTGVIVGVCLMGDGPFITTYANAGYTIYRMERKRRTQHSSAHYRQQAAFQEYHKGVLMYHD